MKRHLRQELMGQAGANGGADSNGELNGVPLIPRRIMPITRIGEPTAAEPQSAPNGRFDTGPPLPGPSLPAPLSAGSPVAATNGLTADADQTVAPQPVPSHSGATTTVEPPDPPKRQQLEAVSPRAWRALLVASLGTVLVGFNSTATNIALDDIRDGFTGATAADVGWGVALFFIGTAAFLPLGGRLADRLGRKRVFQAGLLLFAVSAVLSAAAPTVWTLNLARALQAVGGAAMLPSSLSLVLPMFPQSRRTTAIGLWSAAGPLAAGIAPTASALLLTSTNWRVVYGVSAPVALIMFVIGAWVLAEQPREPGAARLDVLGAAAGTVAMATVVTAIMQGRHWGYLTPITLAVAAVGCAAMVVFVVNSLRHPAPLLNLSILSNRGVWAPNLANFLVGISSQSLWLVWPLFMLNVWDYSKATVGAAVTIGPVVAGLSTVVFSRLAGNASTVWLCRCGAALQITAVTWQLVNLAYQPNYVGAMAPGIALFGLGWGMSTPLLNSLALRWVSESRFGEINGLFNTLRYAAAAVGTAGVFALLVADGGGGALIYYRRVLFFFLCASVAAFVSLWIPMTPKATPKAQRAAHQDA